MHKTALKILRTLIDAQKPLTLADLSKRTGKSKQSIQYHLNLLAKQDLLFREDTNSFMTPSYHLQPAFYDENAIDALYHLLTPFAQATAKQTYGNPQTVLVILKALLELFIADLEERENNFDTSLNDSK